MARPPIIVSNGGVLGALASKCAGLNTEADVIDQMKRNLSDLNQKARDDDPDRPIVRKIVSNNKKEDPVVLWCLANESIKVLKNNLRSWGCKDHQAELSG